MKIELLPFQMNAVRELRDYLYDAQELYLRRKIPQAISFTAPTGAGKTIMLASLVERVYCGDENYLAQPDAIFVWLSDSPELNRQSLDKFYFNADGINHSQLVMIEDETFDAQTLDDGKIYFLNTQKLGKGSNLTRHSDFRQYTIWETLSNTIKAKTDKIYFIIDEAHRGMKGVAAGRATTIMQKFIKGSVDDNFKPVPVVIGMSATIERFNNLVAKSSATIQRVIVTNAEVKASGLLKERIVVIYPDERTSISVAKDMAILEAAADDWKSKCEHWRQYLGDKSFNPIFVVQVENSSAKKISDTDLDDCLKKISQRTGIEFKLGEVVHTFGETADLTINGLRVNHVEPSKISGRDNIRVVFFKENLSTGWDCPKAETMMSFRRAVDATYIAQLLGRMIRTPLQRRIDEDDTLNEVRLYLPHFDESTVQEIVDKLHKSENGEIPAEIVGESLGAKKIVPLTVKGVAKISARTPVENFSAVNSTPLENFTLASEGVQDVAKNFNAQISFDREEIVKAVNALGLSTYKINRAQINDALQSFLNMAHFLMWSNLFREAFDTALDDVAAFIRQYIDELKSAGKYDALNRQAREFKLSAQIFDAFGEGVNQAVSQNLFVTTDTDIERQFRQAEKTLKSAGVANRYLTNFFPPDNLDDGKIDVILFVKDADNLIKLERFAKEKFHALCDKFRREIIGLPSATKNEYDKIVSNGDEVSTHNFELPMTISMTHDVDGKSYSDHLFVDAATGTATIKLNGWEESILHEEQRCKDFVCWLRNCQRAPWSLSIPYQDEHGNTKLFYPDFLIVRRNENAYVVDILEPHDSNFRDNIGKAKALAVYAEENSKVGRLQLIREKNILGQKIFTRLDMSKSAIRDRVIRAASNNELDNIFNEFAKGENLS